MDVNHISIKAIIDDWMTDTGGGGMEMDESALYKWANFAIDRISTAEQYYEKIVLLDVKNYKATLPKGFKLVCQAAYKLEDQCGCGSDGNCLREQITQFTQSTLDGSGCELEINLKCPKCHEVECHCEDKGPIISVDVNRIWETANPQYQAKYMNHFYKHGGTTGRGHRHSYHPDFYLMKRTSNSFFNIPYHINNCSNFHVDCHIEYAISCGTDGTLFLNTNMKEGKVLLSYMGVKTDEDGYRMIPDTEQSIEAIVAHIEKKVAYIAWRKSREQKDRVFYLETKSHAELMIGRARSEMRIPEYDEMHRFVNQHWRRLIPNYKAFNTGGMQNQNAFCYLDQTYNPQKRSC